MFPANLDNMDKSMIAVIRLIVLSVLFLTASTSFSRDSDDTIGGNFQLTAHTGKPFELSDIHGKVGVIFFGFTHCPDVCPTTMLEIQRLLVSLGEDANKVQVLFISVDPKRDTPDKLDTYVTYFNKDIIGLTGTIEEIGSVLEQYHATVSFTGDTSGDNYSVEHNANIFLINREGQVGSIILPRTPYPVFEQQVRKLISQ